METKKKTGKSQASVLKAQNEQLRAKVLEMEKLQSQPTREPAMDRYMSEIRDIQSKGKVESNTIKVKDFSDHKNISLWTKEGKRIGPMHPHNIRKVFEREWNKGNQLSASQPTSEAIAEWKLTPEYAQKDKAYQESRARKNKSKKKGEMEKYLKIIAMQTGQTASQLNNILEPQRWELNNASNP